LQFSLQAASPKILDTPSYELLGIIEWEVRLNNGEGSVRVHKGKGKAVPVLFLLLGTAP
jgi:hypothetical protein